MQALERALTAQCAHAGAIPHPEPRPGVPVWAALAFQQPRADAASSKEALFERDTLAHRSARRTAVERPPGRHCCQLTAMDAASGASSSNCHFGTTGAIDIRVTVCGTAYCR